MATVADRVLVGEVTGLVVTRDGHQPPQLPSRIEVMIAGHPVPDERSFSAADRVLSLAASAGSDDRVVVLISGGGSALLASPIEGLSAQDKMQVHRQLVLAGASIQEINLVRRHLSSIKGGRLAVVAAPAPLLTYVISDVVGDDPAVVASGPTIAQPYEPSRVREVLNRYGISRCADVVAALGRTRPVLSVEHPIEIVASATDALDALESYLVKRGWRTLRLGDQIEGDAATVGANHAQVALRLQSECSRPLAIVSGGELTVSVRHEDGRGGPNLEYLGALMMALQGASGIEALACDSDGIDGTEGNAGGFFDPPMFLEAERMGASQLLARNRSYDLFDALNGLVMTGPTGTNVNDIRVILVSPPSAQDGGTSSSAAYNRDAPLSGKAKDILRDNDRDGYTVPSGGMYPHQWNWDSAFVALGFAVFDMGRAIQELESLLEGQWSDGMVPHIIFRSDDPGYFPGPSVWRTEQTPASSGISQPPVAASIAWRLWQMTTDETQRQRLRVLFPKILSWHRWFKVFRDPTDEGLVVCVHPWESGRDNSPEWDAPAARIDVSTVEPYTRRDLDHADASNRPRNDDYDRYLALVQFGRDCGWDQDKIAKEGPFRVADVGLFMTLLRANRDLAEWARELSEHDAEREVVSWIAKAESGAHRLWADDPGTFCSVDLVSGEPSRSVTSASFLAFYAGVADEAKQAALIKHWDRIAGAVRFMLPSFDPSDPKFDDVRYWRGPCWAVVNFMVSIGLSEAGFESRAFRLKEDTGALIRQSGFREAFAPTDGRGTGGDDFTWTAAMWLAWARLSNPGS